MKTQKTILDTNVLFAGLYSSISAIMTEEYLKQRAKKADKKKFDEILDKISGRKPLLGDELLTCPDIGLHK